MFSEFVLDCASVQVAATIAKLSSLPGGEFMKVRYENRPQKTGETVAFQYFRYGFGGAEKVTFALMGLFAEKGYRVILYTDVAPEPGDYPLPKGVVRKHVATPYDEVEARAAFWREEVLAEGIGTLIYSSWCSPVALIDCLAVQTAGADFVFCVHGSTPFFTQIDDAPLPLRLERVGLAADAISVLSEADAVFWRAYNQNVHVMENPIESYMADAPRRVNMPFGNTVLWCGRFSFYEKRPDEALRIHKLLLECVPDARLVFVGAGLADEEQQLRTLAAQLGIQDSVVFAGYQTDPIPFYHLANVLLVTSSSEGFPLAVSEAMQQGVPVVAYDLEFLQLAQGEGFVQVPQMNRQAAADELARLLRDRKAQEAAGRSARATYEQVCCGDIAGQWGKLLASLEGARDHADVLADDAASLLVRNLMYQYCTRAEKQAPAPAAQDASELERVRRELSELQDSTIVKVGRIATALPRAVKDRLNGQL